MEIAVIFLFDEKFFIGHFSAYRFRSVLHEHTKVAFYFRFCFTGGHKIKTTPWNRSPDSIGVRVYTISGSKGCRTVTVCFHPFAGTPHCLDYHWNGAAMEIDGLPFAQKGCLGEGRAFAKGLSDIVGFESKYNCAKATDSARAVDTTATAARITTECLIPLPHFLITAGPLMEATKSTCRAAQGQARPRRRWRCPSGLPRSSGAASSTIRPASRPSSPPPRS